LKLIFFPIQSGQISRDYLVKSSPGAHGQACGDSISNGLSKKEVTSETGRRIEDLLFSNREYG
jgi:hypothetical protein